MSIVRYTGLFLGWTKTSSDRRIDSIKFYSPEAILINYTEKERKKE